MNLLLDTHVFLWWLENHPRLSARAVSAIAHPDNDIYVSAASIWEIGIKHRLGKLPLPTADLADLPGIIMDEGMEPLSISPAHAVKAAAWETRHRDPFDRMLAAQAQLDRLTLVSADNVFKLFDIKCLW
ncbi:MAG TPA: type II toxin-antitoxin system VapC family toxin [Candidatus Paceibacterota bacterium]|nr:type II toxin-antitoxin system VapC family toxin [Candidatus Paceibacterota bacterium]